MSTIGGETPTSVNSGAPAARGAILGTLILVAAVANLTWRWPTSRCPTSARLRRVADRARPGRRRLLARARGVGALARRARRPVRPQGCSCSAWGCRSRPACSRRGPRRSRCSSSPGSSAACPPAWRIPTTLALITALWSGPARTKSIALWSAIGGAISALGPLVSGLPARALLVGIGLPHHAAAGRGGARDGARVPCRPT